MKKVRIIKIPLEVNTFKRPRQNFPRMRTLYLELIENKDKIKSELFDVTYDDSLQPHDEEPQTPPPKRQTEQTPPVKRNLDFDKGDTPKDNSPSEEKKDVKAVSKEYTPVSSSSPTPIRSEPRRPKVRDDDIDLDKHLDDLLLARNEKKGEDKDKYRKSNFDVSPSNFNKYDDDDDDAPTLSELRRRGHNVPKNMKSVANFNESEEDKKRELLLKIRMLRKYYPDNELPEFSAYSSYNELKNTYDDTFRSLSVDSQVNSYERYIIMISYGMEILAGRFLKFDMQGFTKHQLQNINEYKRLLIELGEKSYTPGGSSLPVEVRLLFICLQQMALFLLMKTSGMGNLMGMLSSLGSVSEGKKQGKMAPPKFS